jgi:hypothetical protein
MSHRIVEMHHDPDEYLDYTWAFSEGNSPVLQTGEVIVDADFHDTPAQIILENVAIGDDAVTAWVSTSGAVVGESYEVPCLITTDSAPARKHDRTIRFKIVSK